MMATVNECLTHDMIEQKGGVQHGVQKCCVCNMAQGRDFVPEPGVKYLDVHENNVFWVTAVEPNSGIVLGYRYPRNEVMPGLAVAAISDLTYFRKWCWA